MVLALLRMDHSYRLFYDLWQNYKKFYSIWELTYYNLSVAYKMTQSNKICPSFQPGQEDKHPKTMNSPGAEGQKQYKEL